MIDLTFGQHTLFDQQLADLYPFQFSSRVPSPA